MDDEEFLRYVAAHSETERTLFSGEHLIRLRDLSGMFLTAMGGIDPDKFYPLHSENAMPLVRRARTKLASAADILKRGEVASAREEASEAVAKHARLTAARDVVIEHAKAYRDFRVYGDQNSVLVEQAARKLMAAVAALDAEENVRP